MNDKNIAYFALLPILNFVENMGTGCYVAILMAANLLGMLVIIAMTRFLIPLALKLPFILLLSATFAGLSHLILQSYWYSLSTVLGDFFPLLLMNVLVFNMLDKMFSCSNVCKMFFDVGRATIISMIFIVLVGIIRELLSGGTVFSGMALYADITAQDGIQLLPLYDGWLMVTMPAGIVLLVAIGCVFMNMATAWCSRSYAKDE